MNFLEVNNKELLLQERLIAETKIILADEPTGNLDFKTSKEIFSLFLKLKKLKKQLFLQLIIENLLTGLITSCLFLMVI